MRPAAVTAKERVVVGGNNQWKGSVAGLGGLSGPVGFPSFLLFVVVCTLLCLFWNECLV